MRESASQITKALLPHSFWTEVMSGEPGSHSIWCLSTFFWGHFIQAHIGQPIRPSFQHIIPFLLIIIQSQTFIEHLFHFWLFSECGIRCQKNRHKWDNRSVFPYDSGYCGNLNGTSNAGMLNSTVHWQLLKTSVEVWVQQERAPLGPREHSAPNTSFPLISLNM
jgi:hypothetical protein